MVARPGFFSPKAREPSWNAESSGAQMPGPFGAGPAPRWAGAPADRGRSGRSPLGGGARDGEGAEESRVLTGRGGLDEEVAGDERVAVRVQGGADRREEGLRCGQDAPDEDGLGVEEAGDGAQGLSESGARQPEEFEGFGLPVDRRAEQLAKASGGVDDVTVALKALLDWEPVATGSKDVVHASIVDPAAAAACWDAGVGAPVALEVGGKIDSREPGPLALRGTVSALADDPRGGRTAAVRSGGLTLIVTTRRNQYTEYAQFERLGIDITAADVVVKIGYLEPDLYEAQRGWLMALTPGGVDQDLLRLGHEKIERPMFPFDPGMDPGELPLRVVVP